MVFKVEQEMSRNDRGEIPEKQHKLTLLDLFSLTCALIVAILLSERFQLKRQISDEADSLNNTKNSNQSLLIFNRTPKAGSETVWELLDQLQYFNNFSSASDSGEVKKSRGYENTYMQPPEQLKYIELLENTPNLTLPFSYVKHMNFINYERFNRTSPIYVNMVRHPVERVISWYYYIRQNWYILQVDPVTNETSYSKTPMGIQQYKMTYEECFTAQFDECVYPVGLSSHLAKKGGSHFSQISFFCGMDPECNIFGSKEGLELAKSNVEKYYAVVGVLEKWQETLQVLEEYVPMFFRNVRKVHKDNLREMVKNANTIKPKIPQAIKDKVAKNFTAEIDFYEFCKQRLYKQYLAIK